MNIMVGATTHKFLMIAAAMCLPAKVNRERVEAVVDDNVPVSVISTKLAARLHIDGKSSGRAPIRLQKPIRISIGAEGFLLATVVIADTTFREGAQRGKDLILGDDMFQDQIIEIDFAAKTLRLILPYERDHYIRNLHPVPVTRGSRGELKISVSFDGATPTDALLDLASETPIAIDATSVDRVFPHTQIDRADRATIESIALGGVSAHNVPALLVKGWKKSLPVDVGLGIFQNRSVIDVRHGAIWLNKL